jgi:hypothetical protein
MEGKCGLPIRALVQLRSVVAGFRQLEISLYSPLAIYAQARDCRAGRCSKGRGNHAPGFLKTGIAARVIRHPSSFRELPGRGAMPRYLPDPSETPGLFPPLKNKAARTTAHTEAASCPGVTRRRLPLRLECRESPISPPKQPAQVSSCAFLEVELFGRCLPSGGKARLEPLQFNCHEAGAPKDASPRFADIFLAP